MMDGDKVDKRTIMRKKICLKVAWCETINLASHHVNSHFVIININIIIFIIIFITIAIIITITTITMLVRYIVAYLLYLAGGCILFESIEEAAESEKKRQSNNFPS